MIENIFQFINDSIPAQEPLKSFIVCGIYALILFLSVLIIGWLINILEGQQIKLLNRFFSLKTALFICNRVTFPGVMIHELSHALFATIFGAKVTKIKLMTIRDNDRLGYIEYFTTGSILRQGLQHTFCSCAPTVVGIILELILYHILVNNFITGIGWKIFTIYMMISIADHMSMSTQDIKNYIKGSWVAIMITYVVLLILRFC
jgi:hypothetical protein